MSHLGTGSWVVLNWLDTDKPRRFVQSFEAVIHEYTQLGLFIGDVQPVFQTVCRQADVFEYVKPCQVSRVSCFGLQEILHFGNVSGPWYTMRSIPQNTEAEAPERVTR